MGLNDTTSNPGMRAFLVPKLACNRFNWVTWKTQVLATLASNKGVMQHLDGSAQQPSNICVYADTHIITEDKEDAIEKGEKCWVKYHQQEVDNCQRHLECSL